MESGDSDLALKNKVELQQVLGLTVCNNSALDSDPSTSTVAYPAGCVVVLYNVRKNKQRYIINDAKKAISCLSFSWDGKYLATGECGTISHLRVWDVQKLTQIADLSGHKHGINCVAFSPNMKYVVSIGSQHDMVVNVWDWKCKVKVASNKVSCKVKAISFSAGGNYFVTVGNNHVKFWYLEYSRSTKYKLEPVPLMGRSAILGDQRNNYFCDVACGRGEAADSTFAITKSGLLCEFNSRRLLDKWVELRITTAISISVGESFIFIGCSDGIVRCFSPVDLHYVCTLPRPHALGVDVAKGLTGKQTSNRPEVTKYPDVIAVTVDESNKKVTCVHNDHSLYVWDIRDIKKIGKSHSFLYHSACIWGIEVYPDVSNEGSLPSGTFFTCANDDTIRIWNVEQSQDKNASTKRNIYCSELLKILYTDPTYSSLCDMDLVPAGISDKPDISYDGKNGVRCLKVRPDGEHLAAGDRSGNVRIYNLRYMEALCKIEAHDSEVLCLEYSNALSDPSVQFLSSASRDRLIHIFDVPQDYTFLQTLDDHSSSVTATKFIHHQTDLHFISCGADKTIIFRKAKLHPKPSFVPNHRINEKTTFYDMEGDFSHNHVLTACQDSKIRIYDVPNGKHIRTISGAQGDGTLIKIAVDSSGTLAATSSTDKTVYIYDYLNGECVASVSGHSELVTGLKFCSSRKQLISVSGDGCIFIWKLPLHITKGNNKNLTNSGIWHNNRKTVAVAKPFLASPDIGNNLDSYRPDSTGLPYEFNVGQLPSWAKKQITDDNSKQPNALTKSATQPLQPRGRWAQRLDGQQLVMKSYLNTDSVIPYPSAQSEQHTEHTMIKYTSMESRNSLNLREETISHSKQISISRTSLLQECESSSPASLPNCKIERVRHPTDSSSASSHKCDDGDAEDERSDSGATENSELVFYPPSEESNETKDSSFHICAVKDEKPLTKSKRGILHSHSSFSITDKTDSISDGDDSAPLNDEHSSSNLCSLAMSTENLDRLDIREKYMLDNYESLNKEHCDENENYQDRLSISAKHHNKSSFPTTNKTFQSTASPISPGSRREELTRALNDARRKLETLGYKNSLSSSKSVGDLRNISENEDMVSRLSLINGSQHAPLWAQARTPNYNTDHSDSDGLKHPKHNLGIHHSSSATSLAFLQDQPKPSPLKKSAAITMNFLEHTDSSPISPSFLNKSQSVLSVNTLGKSISGGRRLSLTGANRKLHYDDSSSSEASPTDTKSNTVVPRGIVARRMRAFCAETSNRPISTELRVKRNRGEKEPIKSKSDWDLRTLHDEPQECLKPNNLVENTKDPPPPSETIEPISNLSKEQAHAEYIKNLEPSPMDLPVRDVCPANTSNYVDVNTTPLTQDLCDKVSEELNRVTTFAMQLFHRVTMDPYLLPAEKSSMTTSLAQGVWQAQQNLQPAVSQIKPSKPDISDPTVAMALLQQYSDRLLSLVEQRITKSDKS